MPLPQIDPIALYREQVPEKMGTVKIVRVTRSIDNDLDPDSVDVIETTWQGEASAVRLLKNDDGETRESIGEVSQNIYRCSVSPAINTSEVTEGQYILLMHLDSVVKGVLIRIDRKLYRTHLYIDAAQSPPFDWEMVT